MANLSYILEGVILEEEIEFTLSDLSQACCVHSEWIITLIDEGILDPSGRNAADCRFSGDHLKRIRTVQRLQNDLGVNLAGSALALELLDEIDTLRARLKALEDTE